MASAFAGIPHRAPLLWPWLSLLLLLDGQPQQVQAAGICEGQKYLRTDGYVFKFSVDIKFHVNLPDNTEVQTIMNSSTRAFEFYRQYNGKLYFKIHKKDGSASTFIVSNSAFSLMTWYTITIEKTVTQICFQNGALTVLCQTANGWDIGDPGEVTTLNEKGVEVINYRQVPMEHAQKFKFNATSGKLYQYFLVAIQDRRAHAVRDDYADVSDPTLGLYTKPKFGSFTRLEYDCGYQYGGVLGSIEIEGNWSWEPTLNSAYRALLATHGSATLVEKTNVAWEPYLPGYPGDGGSSRPWNNWHTGFFANFGSGGFRDLDGEHAYVTTVFTCYPSSVTDFGNWVTWAPSPNGTQDTNKFIRVWLGQEVGASPATTATTTGTCTTTTTTTYTGSTLPETTSTSSTASTTMSSTTTISRTTSISSTSSRTMSSTTGSTTTGSTTTMSTMTTISSSTSTSSATYTATSTSTGSSTTSITITSSSSSSSTSSFTRTTTISSTSSSTRSSTSSSTSSSSSTSTTTTSSTSSTMDLNALLAWVARQEVAIVNTSLSNPNSTILTSLPGLTLAAFTMRRGTGTPGMGLDTVIRVEGTKAKVKVPGSLFDFLGKESLTGVVSVLDSEFASSLGPLDAAMSFNLFDDTGKEVQVMNVPEPFELTMLVNRSEESSCGFWDVGRQEWSRRGMQAVPAAGSEEEELLVCSATHLTFFGALLKGFLMAFNCAQVSLLSSKAVQRLFVGDWWHQPMPLAFWLLGLTVLIMMAAACLLDLFRHKTGMWDNEYFLVPLQSRMQAVGSSPEAPETEEQPVEEHETEGEKTAGQHVKAALSAVVDCILLPCTFCCQSSACRDALDELCSRWFKYFGEVRGFVETICENISCSGSGGCGMKTICASMAGSLIRASVQRQVSASVGVSADVVSCFLEDEDLAEFLSEAAVVSSKLQGAGPTTKWEKRLLAWLNMHQRILKAFDEQWHRTGLCSCPMSILRVFWVANPLAPLFVHCHFTTSAQRVLFFAAELYGALMLVTLFHSVSGTIAEDADPECLEDPADIWEELGRIIAIALCSIVVANIPMMVLETLHSRSFKKFEYEGCPEWKRQLSAWKVQDILVWVIGLLYIGFCGFFVSLFLANAAQEDLHEWGITEGIGMAEDTIVIPLILAFLIPLFAGLCLAFASLTAWAHPREILQKQRTELGDSGGNWKSFVVSI